MSRKQFEIRLTPQAERAYKHLPPAIRKRFEPVFEQFERGEFRHHNVRALAGPLAGSLRYRLAGWRIVFRVDYAEGIVWIEAITTRGGAYRPPR